MPQHLLQTHSQATMRRYCLKSQDSSNEEGAGVESKTLKGTLSLGCMVNPIRFWIPKAEAHFLHTVVCEQQLKQVAEARS